MTAARALAVLVLLLLVAAAVAIGAGLGGAPEAGAIAGWRGALERRLGGLVFARLPVGDVTAGAGCSLAAAGDRLLARVEGPVCSLAVAARGQRRPRRAGLRLTEGVAARVTATPRPAADGAVRPVAGDLELAPGEPAQTFSVYPEGAALAIACAPSPCAVELGPP